jgi:hypothetical protein
MTRKSANSMIYLAGGGQLMARPRRQFCDQP